MAAVAQVAQAAAGLAAGVAAGVAEVSVDLLRAADSAVPVAGRETIPVANRNRRLISIFLPGSTSRWHPSFTS